MKTVMYRIRPTDAFEDDSWRFETIRVMSKTNVTEEMCLRDLYGTYYINNLYDKNNPEYQVEIVSEIEDEY